MNKLKIITTILFFIVSWLIIGVFIQLYIIWTIAYNNPDKTITVYINNYGEATSEIILLTILLIVFFIWIMSISWITIKRLINELGV